MIVLAANQLAASSAFYASVFGWQLHPLGGELTAAVARSGPTITLRADTPEGFQGMVPFLGTADVAATLERVVQGGGAIERAPWQAPMAGTLARFTDPAGTVYGLTSALPPGATPRIPPPFGDAPAPPEGSVCSLEMHAGDLDAAGRFFGDTFGWATQAMMPAFLSFDPGGGIGGVFQSHTPATRAVAYLYAADVAATLAAIDAAGGQRMGDAMAMPGMATFGYFTDPSGTTMGLIGR
jgi:predicted enzyme related to lactoylglutathione lyase